MKAYIIGTFCVSVAAFGFAIAAFSIALVCLLNH